MAYKIRTMKNGQRAPFHFRLHDSRRLHRLRKRDLAELFGVTTSKITEWERGATMPHMNIRRRVELWIDSHYPNPTLDPTLTTPSIYKEGKEDEESDSNDPPKPKYDRPFIPSRY